MCYIENEVIELSLCRLFLYFLFYNIFYRNNFFFRCLETITFSYPRIKIILRRSWLLLLRSLDTLQKCLPGTYTKTGRQTNIIMCNNVSLSVCFLSLKSLLTIESILFFLKTGKLIIFQIMVFNSLGVGLIDPPSLP